MIMHLIKDYFKHTLRSGASFDKFLNQLRLSEKYSQIQLKEFQNEDLRKIIRLAYENVPYYGTLFRELRLSPEDISNVDDLSKLPIIDKNTVKQNFDGFRNIKYHGFVYKGLTGGTTGTPGVFLRDIKSINLENAACWRQWIRLGKVPGSRRVTLRGDIICPIQRKNPPFWKYDRFSKELLMSSYHLNEGNMDCYAKKIIEFKAFDLYAYPSTAYILAEYCLRKKQNINFSAVFTSSENLLDYQKETIQRAFNCKVFDWYGQAERVAALGQCVNGRYHVVEDYSLVEFISNGNGLYEVAGTTFNNFVMPLIRYRTGDIVELYQDSIVCKCGSNSRMVKTIFGREGNFIKTPDNRRVSILNHIPRGIRHLIEMQFVQKSLYEIILRVVCEDGFSVEDERLLIKNARSHISDKIEYKVERVFCIERTTSGKFLSVISEI